MRLQAGRVGELFERDVHNSSLAQRQPYLSAEGGGPWRKVVAGRGSHYHFERMMGAGLLCSQSVAGIGGSPTLAGLADTVPAVLVVVGSRLSHAALPVSSSYGTCGHTHDA